MDLNENQFRPYSLRNPNTVRSRESMSQRKDRELIRRARENLPHTDVWYHGTRAQFKSFSTPGIKRRTSDPISQLGVHFAGQKQTAEDVARTDEASSRVPGKIFHAQLLVHHPKVYSSESDMREEMVVHGKEQGIIRPSDRLTHVPNQITASLILRNDAHVLSWHPKRGQVVKSFRRKLQSQGYDSIIYNNASEGFLDKSSIVFDPKKIHIIGEEII